VLSTVSDAPQGADPSEVRRAARSRRPTVLILTEDSKPALGGIAEGLHHLARTLAATHDVRIVSSLAGAGAVPAEPGVSYEEVAWFRARVSLPGDGTVPLRKVNTALWLATRRRRVRALLARLVAASPPDSILVYRLSGVTYPWCIACDDLGLRYDVMAHGLELVARVGWWATRQRDRALRRASRVLANSRATAALAEARGARPERVRVIPQAIDPSRLPLPDAPLAERARAAAGGRPFVLSVGRLAARKGFDLGIRAFAAVAARRPELAYVLVGEGPEEARLRALAGGLGIADRVAFLGPADDELKLALFAGCELFMMPNRELPQDVEGFGIVFLEAARYGKPVIGGANGGVPDAVLHEETGLLVDTTRDESEVAAALERLLADPALARRLGEAGQRRALRELTWQTVARDVVEALSPATRAAARRTS
jgi:phosphatidyl-myo-inositol dimannoside synthase